MTRIAYPAGIVHLTTPEQHRHGVIRKKIPPSKSAAIQEQNSHTATRLVQQTITQGILFTLPHSSEASDQNPIWEPIEAKILNPNFMRSLISYSIQLFPKSAHLTKTKV
jgi:hypothetical protein